MWLNNYYNKLFAEAHRALGFSRNTYKVPSYQNMNGAVISTQSGDRPTGNNLIDSDAVCGMAAFFSAINGSVTTNDDLATYAIGMRALFGTGNTPAKVTDYKLENLIESDLAFVVNVAFDSETRVVTQIVNVTATAEKVIAEVGLAHGPTLVYRKVLTNPITLASGESLNVTFALNLGTGAMSVSV